MKTILLSLFAAAVVLPAFGQNQTIKLFAPSQTGGKTVIEALWERKSTREFSPEKLTPQELADLLWAANGVNRPKEGKRTAPSAMNKQDVEVYVCFPDGCYRYDAPSHTLIQTSTVDARPLKTAPLCLVLVSDKDFKYAAMDVGIVSQNISLYCAAFNLATVARGSMDAGELAKALNLPEGRVPYLNHPVGHIKK